MIAKMISGRELSRFVPSGLLLIAAFALQFVFVEYVEPEISRTGIFLILAMIWLALTAGSVFPSNESAFQRFAGLLSVALWWGGAMAGGWTGLQVATTRSWSGIAGFIAEPAGAFAGALGGFVITALLIVWLEVLINAAKRRLDTGTRSASRIEPR